MALNEPELNRHFAMFKDLTKKKLLVKKSLKNDCIAQIHFIRCLGLSPIYFIKQTKYIEL